MEAIVAQECPYVPHVGKATSPLARQRRILECTCHSYLQRRNSTGIVRYLSECYNQNHTSLSPTYLAHCAVLSLKDMRLAGKDTDRIGAVQTFYKVF